MLVVQTVLSTVSETCDSTAHRSHRGLQQPWNCFKRLQVAREKTELKNSASLRHTAFSRLPAAHELPSFRCVTMRPWAPGDRMSTPLRPMSTAELLDRTF